MLSAVETFATTFCIVQTGVSITLNICITCFCFESLKKQRSFNSINIIYFTMGLVNVFMQLTQTTLSFSFCFWPELIYIRNTNVTITFLMFGLLYSNYWLTGWLCAYYCININNFTLQAIVRFKKVFSSFLPHILLISTMGSFILSALCIWMVDVMFVIQTSKNSTWDFSIHAAKFVMPTGYRIISSFLGCCLPFVLAFISIGVTTSSLIKHIMNMKEKVSEHYCPNLQALIRATRTMVLFLTLCVLSFIAELFFFSSSTFSSSNNVALIAWIIITSLPSAESVIIIQATPMLRKMIVEMFRAKRQNSNVID